MLSTFPLATGWLARSKADVSVDGTVITSPSYSVEGWLDAVVPGSVLATLVKNNKAPDPFYGVNSCSIPDAGTAGIGLYTYWFYNAFQLPVSGRRVELRFDGINYAASIYFNGRKLGDVAGMFLRHVFDITPFVVAGENRLAVLVTPPDPPGLINGNGGKPGPPNIAESVVARYPVGWDWVASMPDRSAGIWDGVSVCFSGPVTIGDPQVDTRVHGVRTPGAQQNPASLRLTTVVTNTSTDPVSGVLSCAVDGKTDEQDVTIPPGQTQPVTFVRQINNPRLWWPNGMGQHELYPVMLTFTIGPAQSDQRSFRFGVRQIDVSTINVSNSNGTRQTRVFHVNGQPIFLRGGNWIGTDAMFRYSTNAKRYRDEVRMHADANLNVIRVWGGGIAERDPFYEACDEYGLLVMQDFWISGEYSYVDFPFSDTWTKVFLASAADTIKRLQHHPSLLFWSGGNEMPPPDDIDTTLQGWIQGPGEILDGTRVYVNCSTNISGSSQDLNEDGPYGILYPQAFFGPESTNPINPELGSIGTPTFESLQLFIPADALANFPKPNQPYDQSGPVWLHHDYMPYFHSNPDVADQIGIYETPATPQRFAYLAQLANYIQYRALFEGFSAHMWEWYAGVFLWKSQNPWTGLRGSLYDWYLEQTGGLFGVSHACEPLHVQLNLATNEVMVVNTSAQPFGGAATAKLYDLSGRASNGGAASVSVKQEAKTIFRLQNVPKTPNTVYFVELYLTDTNDKVVSTNFYWLTTGDYQPLRTGLAKVKVDAIGRLTRQNDRWVAMVALVNAPGQTVAFWIRLQVLSSKTSQRVLPVFYQDNYISLVPGAVRELRIDFAAADVPSGEDPRIWIEGWNVARTQVILR